MTFSCAVNLTVPTLVVLLLPLCTAVHDWFSSLCDRESSGILRFSHHDKAQDEVDHVHASANTRRT